MSRLRGWVTGRRLDGQIDQWKAYCHNHISIHPWIPNVTPLLTITTEKIKLNNKASSYSRNMQCTVYSCDNSFWWVTKYDTEWIYTVIVSDVQVRARRWRGFNMHSKGYVDSFNAEVFSTTSSKVRREATYKSEVPVTVEPSKQAYLPSTYPPVLFVYVLLYSLLTNPLIRPTLALMNRK